MIEITEPDNGPRIMVVGIGGAGGNAINHLVRSGLCGVEYIAINTDAQDLKRSLAPRRFELGKALTKGCGAGSDPEVGREAALGDRERIKELLTGANMVFIVAGMGGGTGTGATPVMCELAQEMGILTVAVMIMPFSYEGEKRCRQAEDGAKAVMPLVDMFITIRNDAIQLAVTERALMWDAFAMVDDMLLQAVKGISDLITYQGLINVDFADVRRIVAGQGQGVVCFGTGNGETRVKEALERALSSPLMPDSMGEVALSASHAIVNITGSSNLAFGETQAAFTAVRAGLAENVHLIIGLVIDESMGDSVRVTLILTGFRPVEEKVDSPKSTTGPTRPARSLGWNILNALGLVK